MKDTSSPDYQIIDVWNSNLENEFRKIRKIVQDYKYVAMDTEFPGVVAKIGGDFKTADYQYQCLKCNVDLLKIIQLGFTFMNEKGVTPIGASTFQFNFQFNLNEDMYAQESIDLLSKSGIQFQKHLENGIDPLHFAELLTSSGVILMDDITWISFHSSYDFGYLIKMLTNRDLPNTEVEFVELLKIFFPSVFDIKYLMKSCRNLKGGLEEVARQLEIERYGPQHQAGSDSLLTGSTFFKLKELYFDDAIDSAKYSGNLFGLGSTLFQNGIPPYEYTQPVIPINTYGGIQSYSSAPNLLINNNNLINNANQVTTTSATSSAITITTVATTTTTTTTTTNNSINNNDLTADSKQTATA